MSNAATFAVLFMVFNRKKYMTGERICCFRIGTSYEVKKTFYATPKKAGSWYLLGVLFKIADEHPRPLNMEVPSPPPRWTGREPQNPV